MLILYAGKEPHETEWVQEMLEDLVLAYQVEHESTVQEIRLESNDKQYFGMEEIKAHIEELAKLKDAWDRFQGDSCYCGDDGEII